MRSHYVTKCENLTHLIDRVGDSELSVVQFIGLPKLINSLLMP